MRKLSLLAALLLAVGGACGDDDSAPTPDSSGMNPDGSGMTPDGSGMTPDGSGMTPDGSPGVTCGTMTCTPGMECCVTSDMMMPPNPVFMCIAAGGACMGVASVCDGPEDCDMGERCCGMFAGGGSLSTECRGSGGGACQPQLCHDAADCPAMHECCPFMYGGTNVSICSQFGCFP